MNVFYWPVATSGLSPCIVFNLSLHHLTALDVSPAALVEIAAACDCRKVSLFTHMPAPFRDRYPMVEAEQLEDLTALLAHTGIQCHSLEVFPLLADPDWPAMTKALDMGQCLQARFATVHCHLDDQRAAAMQLTRLAAIAGERGISLAVEFNPFSRCATLAQAVQLVGHAAVHGAKVGLVLDSLHAARTGTRPADIAAAHDLVSYVQLSDGPVQIARQNRWKEAIGQRMLPLAGELPLAEMLAGLSHDMVLDVEIPRQGALNGDGQHIPAAQRCKAALDATRTFLLSAGFAYSD